MIGWALNLSNACFGKTPAQVYQEAQLYFTEVSKFRLGDEESLSQVTKTQPNFENTARTQPTCTENAHGANVAGEAAFHGRTKTCYRNAAKPWVDFSW